MDDLNEGIIDAASQPETVELINRATKVLDNPAFRALHTDPVVWAALLLLLRGVCDEPIRTLMVENSEGFTEALGITMALTMAALED